MRVSAGRPRAVDGRRWQRIAARVLAGLLILWWGAQTVTLVLASNWTPGMDFQSYLEATRSWLAGGDFYPAVQVAGPYTITTGAILYPPVALVLFVPFTVLPAFLWWAVPIGVMAGVLWHHRPSPAVWLVILASLALWFNTTALYWFGTPTIWMAAFVALGTVCGWPAVLVALKPSIAPFALLGIRDRRWWIAAAALGLVSLALLPMWGDWVRSVLNARGPGAGWWYSYGDIPLLLIPVVAWLGRRRDQSSVANVTWPRRKARR